MNWNSPSPILIVYYFTLVYNSVGVTMEMESREDVNIIPVSHIPRTNESANDTIRVLCLNG